MYWGVTFRHKLNQCDPAISIELTGLPPVLLGMTLSNTGDMQIHPDKKSIMTKGKSGEWSWI